MNRVQVIIPIYKPDEKLIHLLNMLKKQTYQPFSLLLIDSGSNGEYRSFAEELHARVIKIDAAAFDHGGTRQWAVEQSPDADFYVFFTQDAVPVDEYALQRLLAVFDDEKVGCAFGRQLPNADADESAKQARLINYPEDSYIYTIKDAPFHGIKTPFLSDSFAAYRAEALKQINGFPRKVILGEDMFAAAKMLMAGWSKAYVAEAKVYHSHNYTFFQEFKRYFDTGVFHSKEKWLLETFGTAEGAGLRLVVSEIKYLINHNPLKIIPMIIRNGMKFLGYRLGLRYYLLSKGICRSMSMTYRYWD